MKVVSLDFEMTGLNADFGMLMCGVFQTWGEKGQRIYRLDETDAWKKGRRHEDKQLAKDLRDEIDGADIIVTWNGKRFDIPFLNSRLIYHGLVPTKRVKHIDLLYQARYKWKLHSARLDSVLDHLGAPEPMTKTRIKPGMWIKAVQGNKAAMDYIVTHCKRDVFALDWVYNKMKDMVTIIHP